MGLRAYGFKCLTTLATRTIQARFIDSSRRWVLELELCTSCASFGSRQLGPAVQSERVHVLVGKIHLAVSPEMTPVLDALLRTMAKVGGRSKRGAAPRN